ncbi:MAG: AbrB/MazE/SpoVT family DNA-binding domain-containing protein [Candidatus Lokiarchaeota archaeon]|nr:AbrB/MazE/SpoVT family DNA-binding domain-containing protein [Candidatus Lokiarchaeota archaeon]
MKVSLSKITKKGQITIPIDIRKNLKIKQGDFLAITTENDYILIKKVKLPSLKDIFSEGKRIAKEKHITQEDVINACREARHAY